MPLAKYHYDGLNRLVREDNYLSAEAYTWTYDVGGNITEKKTYTLSGDIDLGQVQATVSYAYGNTAWKDQLTEYNGQRIEYDALGNPTEYKGNELKWTRVRQLASYGSNTFQYGVDGIRCKKNETDYILSGSRILKEIRGNISLTYYYGMSGVIGFQYDDEDYFYQKNLQGDITGIYTSNGTLVAEYKYDAWGKVLAVVNHTSANIGDLNPFRYRGYYYDTETDLYYLQTRYYDPETGRFINADDLAYLGADESLSSYNLYAYCANNPVMGCDPTGEFFFTAVGAIIGAITGAIDSIIMGGTVEDIVRSTFAGAASGAIAGAGVDIGIAITVTTGGTGIGIGLAVAGVLGAFGGVIGTGISTSWQAETLDYVASALVGGMLNMISFGLAPINGEIVKGSLSTITKEIIRAGINDFAMNIGAGVIVALGATWITRVMTA